MLAEEWHEDNPLLPSKVSAASHVRCLWRLKTCGHVASISPANRTKKEPTRCKECFRQRQAERRHREGVERNPLTAHALLAAEWHEDNERSVDDVAAGQDDYAKWRCSKCGCEWFASPVERAQGNRPCPDCSRQERYRKSVQRNPVSNHLAAVDWHPANLLGPDEVSASDRSNWRWICHACQHEWLASPANRTKKKNPTGCRRCFTTRGGVLNTQRGALRNPVAAYPAAVDWHPDNALSPQQVPAGANWKVLWLCHKCGTVEEKSPNSKVLQGAGCTGCESQGWTPASFKLVLKELGVSALLGPDARERLSVTGIFASRSRARTLAEAIAADGVAESELNLYLNDKAAPQIEAILASPSGFWYRPWVSARDRISTYEHDSYRCVLCGQEDELEIDHFWPFSRGGDHALHNYWTLCLSCNRGKRNRLPDLDLCRAFIDSRGALASPPPHLLSSLPAEIRALL